MIPATNENGSHPEHYRQLRGGAPSCLTAVVGQKMNSIEELKVVGIKLASDIQKEASRYHVKSDDHDIYDWEAAILLEHMKAKEEGREPIPNLRDSALLSEWGQRMQTQNPELSRRVREFYTVLNQK